MPLNRDNLENSIETFNKNMNIGRALIELCIVPYQHLKSLKFQKESIYYKLGYSVGLYAETLMFYGTSEQKYKGLRIAKSTFEYNKDDCKLIYAKPDKRVIRQGFETDIDIVFDLYKKTNQK